MTSSRTSRRIAPRHSARKLAGLMVLAAPFLAVTSHAQAPQATPSPQGPQSRIADPGPRGGPPDAGGPLSGLGTLDLNLFNAAKVRFQEIDSVSGGISGETGVGLGPRFNLNGCAGCHAQPTIGGTSPATNPEFAVATLDGAKNTIPSFISLHGPVREARFVLNPDGTPDGGVHNLFVITGRSDATGCNIQQPDFADALRQNNVIFRIPTPTFGLGLVENVPDSNLINAVNSEAGLRQSLGISGQFNRSGNDGTITRFGWKAQNKSLLMFAGEAYNVEQGVTNELFPDERETNANCQFNALPEDSTNVTLTTESNSPASDYSSDIVNFAAFMRLSAPPAPAPAAPVTTAGRGVFLGIGCNGCHVVQQTTAVSTFTNQATTFQPFSDFAVHSMGQGLADGITQGNAGGNQFRTAPLWGLGQRLFLLHDGRTSDLIVAIEAHASNGSEANQVIANFNMLPAVQKQALLDFLRSL
ncbi:MAG TPA: di-heme oxidoredictase family protein [Stellaceae bacterium]|nr:di-heme oxidoredictase family protein [Stellaceae bacterium]